MEFFMGVILPKAIGFSRRRGRLPAALVMTGVPGHRRIMPFRGFPDAVSGDSPPYVER
jgi:hypothetical protein